MHAAGTFKGTFGRELLNVIIMGPVGPRGYMSDFVKGPWEASRRNWLNEPVKRDIYITGDLGNGLCTAVAIVPGNATSRKITVATARLIEAAPDLLAACELIRKAIADGSWDIKPCPELDTLDAAITKAKGG